MINNKTIFISGGTGSFGKHLTLTLLKKYNPKKIIIFSRDEFKQFEFKGQIPTKFHKKVRFFIGDIRDYQRLKSALLNTDIVFHAAALKHVPALEYNPFEAVKTNIIGSQNLITACQNLKIKKVIALSTDKAAAPINLYGATKLTADKLFVASNNYSGSSPFAASVVRYGNVMSSRGSVIPHFKKNRDKKFLEITDLKMTRFNITLDQGVNFVLDSLKRMVGGEIFVPKIPSYRITDLAKAIAPQAKFKVVGKRPGEKINEEMITISDAVNSIDCKSYYVILPSPGYLSKNHLKKIIKINKGKLCKKDFSYNSGNNKHFLTISDLKKLI